MAQLGAQSVPLTRPHSDAPTVVDAGKPDDLTARLRDPKLPPDAATVTRARARGFALLRAARYAEAAELFNALSETAVPRDQLSLYGAALAAFNLKRVGDAERSARQSVAASGFDAAIPAARLSDEARANTADALVLLAVVLAVKGDNNAALQTVKQAVALAPRNFDAQFALGRALYGAGDPAGATAAFRAALELRPDDARARFFLATALERAGDQRGALDAYRELLKKQPDSADGHLGLGVLLVKLGGEQSVEGVNELVRAVALNGNLYEARAALGRALVRANRFGEAVEHLRRAAELAPGNPEPHYQLALAYRRLGRVAEAAAETAAVRRIHDTRRAATNRN